MAESGTQQLWRTALHRLGSVLLPYEIKAIESNVQADPRLEQQAEQASEQAGENLLGLVNVFKPYLLPEPKLGNISEMTSYNNFMKAIDERAYEKLTMMHKFSEQQGAPRADLSNLLDWLPREDNPYSLGRKGSTRVQRKDAVILDIGVDSFPAFWEGNREGIRQSIPEDCLHQVVTDETNRDQSYRKQRNFLMELTRAIARARGVNVGISGGSKGSEDVIFEGSYSRRPDSFFKVGDKYASLELKTMDEEGEDSHKIAIARGQVVILGNSLFRIRTRTEPNLLFENEVYGFVGNGIQLQTVRQIHAYGKRVRAFDGPLLELAEGQYSPGDVFKIDLNSGALKWAAAALDRMLMTEAVKLKAGSEVIKDVSHRDYGKLKLIASGGYWIGNEYLDVKCSAPFEECIVNVVGAARNNEISVVMKVVWDEEIWWLKVGPDIESRDSALRFPDELPTGGWERWFQTERDMLSRALLGEFGGRAFAVSIEGGNRPAMLVKDAGDSVEKQLFSRHMQPAEVHEMSKQLYVILEASGKRGVIHGDVCLENICYKDGVYSLIDWGLACGRGFSDLAAAVDKAWPVLDVMDTAPGIPNWEMSPDCCFCGSRPHDVRHDMESLLYCCMKILGGNTLPWSDAASSGTEFEVLQLRAERVSSFVMAQGRYIYQPLLLKLGRVFTVNVEQHLQALEANMPLDKMRRQVEQSQEPGSVLSS